MEHASSSGGGQHDEPSFVSGINIGNHHPNGYVSRGSLVFICSIAVLMIVQVFINFRWIVVLPIVFSPTLGIVIFWRKNKNFSSINSIVKAYGIGFLPGAIIVMIAEFILGFLIIMILFQSELSQISNSNNDSNSDSNIIPGQDGEKAPFDPEVMDLVGKVNPFKLVIGAFLVSFVVAGLCEEALKYFIVSRSRIWQPRSSDKKSLLVYAFSGALGFSTLENWIYTRGAGEYFGGLLFISISRLLLATTLHTMTGILIGIGFLENEIGPRRKSPFQILRLPIIIHGLFDFFLFLLAIVSFHANIPIYFCVQEGLCFGPLDFVAIIFELIILTLAFLHLRRRIRFLNLSFHIANDEFSMEVLSEHSSQLDNSANFV